MNSKIEMSQMHFRQFQNRNGDQNGKSKRGLKTIVISSYKISAFCLRGWK